MDTLLIPFKLFIIDLLYVSWALIPHISMFSSSWSLYTARLGYPNMWSSPYPSHKVPFYTPLWLITHYGYLCVRVSDTRLCKRAQPPIPQGTLTHLMAALLNCSGEAGRKRKEAVQLEDLMKGLAKGIASCLVCCRYLVAGWVFVCIFNSSLLILRFGGEKENTNM